MELKWLILNKWRRLVPLITFEISFGQHVCELMFGVKTDLDLGVQMNPVKQPIQGSSVGPWNMPHFETSTFDNHLDYCLVVKDIQHDAGVRMRCIWWNVINVCWNDVGVLDWDGVVHVWLWHLPTGFSVALSPIHQFCSVQNEILQPPNPRERAGIPSMRKPASREMISVSVELCETEVCFLHIKLVGTNVCLPKMHRILPDVDFESSRSLAKSESWNNPSLHCCAVYSHLTKMPICTCMMNVRDQTRQAFVARFCPFCESTRKLVHRPQNVRSPNTS